MDEYDIIIIGAGAAGLTAGLYAARAGMKVKALEKASVGGQLLLSETIENFPGFPEGIKGQELSERLKTQALNSGLGIVAEEVKEIVFIQPAQALSCYTLKTENMNYKAHSLILACGVRPKRLGLAAEKRLTGHGVSYCATCDGPLFRGREVVVIGGGNAAAEEALFLSKFARRVNLVHRRARLRADKVFQERLKNNPKINFIWNSQALQILGENKVTGVKIKDVNTAKEQEVPCEGVFIFVGFKPGTDFLKGLVDMDAQGFIITDENLQTSRKGIFACGDCRAKELRQIVTACGEGALAAQQAQNYVERLKGTAYV